MNNFPVLFCDWYYMTSCSTGAQAVEPGPDSFLQHPRYVEMCVLVMQAAVQQGLASSVLPWGQAVLQNVRANCKMPPAEFAR